ncbi:glycosyltransferase [Prevotella sp. KH2C16]|uniref:glycosyltransferase n=1 Tax=Prevotella sp. KH2C16 TaxID=1855325 RepID=UPI0008ED5439|nr:glycosyltransferase [Prevotella sp. KH2C16]SFG53410.1 Glycosyltransferase involved in cell wall bisynthesis [Prevotella sp. KH2C16]
MPRLSYIIPIYNTEQYLSRCVGSIYEQGIPECDFEVILVNDGSTDNSYVVAQKIASVHGNIKLYTQENQGQSVARNLGMKHAKGDYLAFIDSDDWLIPHTIRPILEQMENKDLDIISFRLIYQTLKQSNIGSTQPLPKMKVMSGEEALLAGLQLWSVCTSLYSTQMIKEHNLKFVPKILSEDVEFNARAYSYAKRVMFTDYIAYYYFMNSESSTADNDKKKRIRKYSSVIYSTKSIRNIATEIQSSKLKENFIRRANSSIVGFLISLMRNSFNLDVDTRLGMFDNLKQQGLYPIKGDTLSWKTSLLVRLLNCNSLVKAFIR